MSEDQEPSAVTPFWKRGPVIFLGALGMVLVALIVVAVISFSGESEKEFANRDPRGYEACQALKTAGQYSGDGLTAFGAELGAAKAALLSNTPEIRKTAKSLGEDVEGLDDTAAGRDVAEFGTVDAPALAKICRDKGVDIPKLKEEGDR